jgi:hypothetical protein
MIEIFYEKVKLDIKKKTETLDLQIVKNNYCSLIYTLRKYNPSAFRRYRKMEKYAKVRKMFNWLGKNNCLEHKTNN